MRIIWRVSLVGLVAFALSGCWPTPGAGPDRRSFNPYERGLTPATVARLTEAYRIPLAHGAGAPVITRAGLFVRDGVSISAFDPGTGAHRWTTRVPEVGIPDDLYRVSDPMVLPDDQQVVTGAATPYGGEDGSWLLTLRAGNGQEQIRRYAGGRPKSLRGRLVGTVSYDNVPFLGGPVRYVAVNDVDTGRQVWGGYAFDEPRDGEVSLAPNRLLVAGEDEVEAYDTTTPCPPWSIENPFLLACEAEWKFQPGQRVTPVVIGDNDTLYVGTATNQGPNLYALLAGSGGTRWRSSLGGSVTVPPALADGHLYPTAGFGVFELPADGCGASVCDGRQIGTLTSVATVQPVVAGGVVYIGSADGTVSAFDAGGGCNHPSCQVLWSANTGAPVTGGMAVVNSTLYVGTQTGLVAYRLRPAG